MSHARLRRPAAWRDGRAKLRLSWPNEVQRWPLQLHQCCQLLLHHRQRGDRLGVRLLRRTAACLQLAKGGSSSGGEGRVSNSGAKKDRLTHARTRAARTSHRPGTTGAGCPSSPCPSSTMTITSTACVPTSSVYLRTREAAACPVSDKHAPRAQPALAPHAHTLLPRPSRVPEASPHDLVLHFEAHGDEHAIRVAAQRARLLHLAHRGSQLLSLVARHGARLVSYAPARRAKGSGSALSGAALRCVTVAFSGVCTRAYASGGAPQAARHGDVAREVQLRGRAVLAHRRGSHAHVQGAHVHRRRHAQTLKQILQRRHNGVRRGAVQPRLHGGHAPGGVPAAEERLGGLQRECPCCDTARTRSSALLQRCDACCP
jgi:hypothetical protein